MKGFAKCSEASNAAILKPNPYLLLLGAQGWNAVRRSQEDFRVHRHGEDVVLLFANLQQNPKHLKTILKRGTLFIAMNGHSSVQY